MMFSCQTVRDVHNSSRLHFAGHIAATRSAVAHLVYLDLEAGILGSTEQIGAIQGVNKYL